MGYLRRKQGVRGAGSPRACRRSHTPDFGLLRRGGFAYVPMKELQRLLRCNMPGGCAMAFKHDRPGSGLPLSVIAANPQARVRLRCQGCKWEKIITPPQAIRRLKLAKTGTESTLHTELVAKLNKPCPKCAKTVWACDILWPAPPGSPTPGEKSAAELRRQGRYGVRD